MCMLFTYCPISLSLWWLLWKCLCVFINVGPIMGARSILDLYIYWTTAISLSCNDVSTSVAYWGLHGSTTCRLAKWKWRVVRSSKNGGDNSFCHILVIFLSRFQVGAGVQLYICLSDGCRSTLHMVKLRKFEWYRRLRTTSGNPEYGCTDIGPPEGDVYRTGG